MKRDKLEMYLGKEVIATMWDGETTTGILIKGDGHERNYYQCSDSFWFRSSHVTKVKEAGWGVEQLLQPDESRLSKC